MITLLTSDPAHHPSSSRGAELCAFRSYGTGHSDPSGQFRARRPRKLTTNAVTALAVVVLPLAMTTAVATAAAPSGANAPLSTPQIAAFAKNANKKVIVLFKNQPAAAPVGSRAAASRAQVVAKSQSGVVSELKSLHAGHLRGYQLVNSVSATVSAAEAARLKTNPAVAAVIPDSIIRLTQPSSTSGARPATSTSLTPNVIRGRAARTARCNSIRRGCSPRTPIRTDPNALTARSLGITGAGVKVAWIADGIDPEQRQLHPCRTKHLGLRRLPGLHR